MSENVIGSFSWTFSGEIYVGDILVFKLIILLTLPKNPGMIHSGGKLKMDSGTQTGAYRLLPVERHYFVSPRELSIKIDVPGGSR